LEDVAEKHEIHKTHLRTARIYRRGDAARVTHENPFDSIDTISFITMMKREYFFPGL
jgi:hypothetical protein